MYVYILYCIKSSDTYTGHLQVTISFTVHKLYIGSSEWLLRVCSCGLEGLLEVWVSDSFINILAADRNRLQEKVLLLYGLGYYLVC